MDPGRFYAYFLDFKILFHQPYRIIPSSLDYANTSRDLWDSLKEKLGQSNDPLVYQLQKELANLNRGNIYEFNCLTTYYLKIQKLDSYISCSAPIPETREQTEMHVNRNKLMHFLTGLGDGYEL